MSAIWQTVSGEKLEIKWMTSRHLINSINFVKRGNAVISPVPPLFTEASRRRLIDEGHTNKSQLTVPRGETETELIWMNAILDINNPFFTVIMLRSQSDWTIKVIQNAADGGDPNARAIVDRAAFYRMTR